MERHTRDYRLDRFASHGGFALDLEVACGQCRQGHAHEAIAIRKRICTADSAGREYLTCVRVASRDSYRRRSGAEENVGVHLQVGRDNESVQVRDRPTLSIHCAAVRVGSESLLQPLQVRERELPITIEVEARVDIL